MLLIAAFVLAPTWAAAETDFPSRTIRLIVLNAAGGGQDVVMRIVTRKLGELFGYSFAIINQPGANGEIGKRECASAEPNGYTFCSIADGTAAIYPAVYAAAKEPIPGHNLTPVRVVADQYFAFFVREGRPATFPSFVEAARKNPDGFVCGSANPSGKLGMAILNAIPGVKVREAPYRAGEEGKMLRDIRAGELDCFFGSMTSALSHVRAGAINALGTFGPKKNPFLPNVPTLEELGYPAFGKLPSWYAVWGPPALPRSVVDRLNRELDTVTGNAEIAERLAKGGVIVRRTSPPEELAAEGKHILATSLALICEQGIVLIGRTCKK